MQYNLICYTVLYWLDLPLAKVFTETGADDGPMPTEVLAAIVILMVANLGRPVLEEDN